MKEFYKILLDKSKKNNGFMKGNFDDIQEGFKERGYKEYCFGGFYYIYSKTELSDEEKTKCENEAKRIIDANVDEITKEINKRILEDILKNDKARIRK